MSKVIGIDLGTTNTCVAVMEGGQPEIIPNALGHRVTPSVVGFLKNGQQAIGDIAKRQAASNPTRTVRSIKRYMGMRFDEAQSEIATSSFKVIKGDKGQPLIEIDDEHFSPEEISARILSFVRTAAETHLGEEVSKAVITVPAYFNDDQRKATQNAGRIAGLDVLRIINEPTAAAMAFGLDNSKTQKIAVYDLGGGTFDISILDIGDGVFEVKSTAGDTHLGGDDIDNLIIDWLINQFKSDTGIDLKGEPTAMQRLKEESEKSKCELSALQQSTISLPFIAADQTGPKHLEATLSRAQLEHLIEGLINRTLEICGQAIQDAQLQSSDIQNVLLVGGSTRIPYVRQAVEQFFGRKATDDVNPDEVVAMGAAVQGGVLTGDVQDVLLLDVTPLSLGISAHNGVFVKFIERNTTIPTSHKQIFTTAEDDQTSVHVHVFQGERAMAKNNRSLASFNLFGIPPAPRRIPKIEVSFDIDVNGVLHVSAKDKGTGRIQQVRIDGSSQLNESEVKEMVTAAGRHSKDDEHEAQLTMAITQAEYQITHTQETIERFESRLSRRERNAMDDALEELHEAMNNQDLEKILVAMDKINVTWTNIQRRLIEIIGDDES